MTKIVPQPGIMDIALYKSGEAALQGVSEVLKLSANENPYGPSELAKEAFARTAATLHRYPGTDHAELRLAVSDIDRHVTVAHQQSPGSTANGWNHQLTVIGV